MCFEFGSCFGSGRQEDYGGERMALGGRADHRNGYYSGIDHNAPLAMPAYHQQPHAAAVDEAGHKAHHDGARKDHLADAGGHGRYYAAYVHDKADNDAPKLPAAWHNKVGDDAGYTYTASLHETAAHRRENGALDYHHYPTSTANTTLVRY